jgi:hypothetical protein
MPNGTDFEEIVSVFSIPRNPGSSATIKKPLDHLAREHSLSLSFFYISFPKCGWSMLHKVVVDFCLIQIPD